jgi:hypothetical protein
MGAQADRWENGRRVTRDQGKTWGPPLSKEMDAASCEFHEAYHSKRGSPGYETGTYWSTTMKLCRAAGADVEKWFRARVFQLVSGPVAEAIASNRSFDQVWNGDGWNADDDRTALGSVAKDANVGTRKLASTVNRMAVVSAYLMDKPEVWAAVVALANKLPEFGTMPGSKAAKIITRVIPEAYLTDMFAAALERVREFDKKIRAATVVSMQTTDGSNIAIKRGNLSGQGRAKGKKNVHDQPLQYQGVFPVLAETLCRAFGESALQKGSKAA